MFWTLGRGSPVAWLPAWAEVPHVDLAGHLREAAVAIEPGLPAAHVGGVVVEAADVLHVLGVGEDLEELDRVRTPAGDVAGQFLQDQYSPFAAAEGDGVGDFRAGVVDGGGDASDGLVANEVADVGNDPGRAGLDELVVVELVEVGGEGLELLSMTMTSDCSGPR